MAYKISGGTVQPASNSIAAHNLTHKAVGAIEVAAGSLAHYDGVEVSAAGVAELISTTYGVPTTLANAVDIFNEAKRILNLHYGYHNTGGTAGVFAHKDDDTAIAVADLSAGSVYDAAVLALVKTLIDEIRIDYALHQASATYHSTADTTYVLGGSPTISSWSDAAEALNNIKAQFNLHAADATLHDTPDAADQISTANAVYTDIDSCVALANAIKSKYEAHRTRSSVHFTNDTTNTISAANAALSSDLTGGGALPTAIRSSYESHRASTSWHANADSTNTISASAVATVANLIALAAELRTDIDAHLANAPVSRAQRGV